MINYETILSTVVDAVQKANKDYLKWSAGMDIYDSGVEPIISARVARNLYNVDKGSGHSVTLETRYDMIKAHMTNVIGAPRKTFSKGARADVVYWSKDVAPVGVIEVKRSFRFYNIQTDLKRTMDLIEAFGSKRGNSLRWGVCTGMRRRKLKANGEGGKSIKENRASVLQKCRDNYPQWNFSIHSSHVPASKEAKEEYPDFVGYDAYALLFRPKRA